jgi:uncharacterized protein (DUF58 family)
VHLSFANPDCEVVLTSHIVSAVPDVKVKINPLTAKGQSRVDAIASASIMRRGRVSLRLSVQMQTPIEYREISPSLIIACRDLESLRFVLAKLRRFVASLDGVTIDVQD